MTKLEIRNGKIAIGTARSDARCEDYAERVIEELYDRHIRSQENNSFMFNKSHTQQSTDYELGKNCPGEFDCLDNNRKRRSGNIKPIGKRIV